MRDPLHYSHDVWLLPLHARCGKHICGNLVLGGGGGGGGGFESERKKAGRLISSSGALIFKVSLGESVLGKYCSY